ncbi:ATP-binding protein [Sorangium sp. So ce1036]|uniref:ATP-binding protein n=1 Tax=Sorangium sp. So ce1036 TaxID=3133328 RepID=UPI003F0A17B7
MKPARAATGSSNPLSASLAAVRACIERASNTGPPPALPEPPSGSPLAALRDRFHLSAFDVAVIACAAAVELSPGFSKSCGAALGDPARRAPTVALCIARLPGARWDAFSPGGPLCRFRLVRLGEGDVFTGRSVTLPEPVLHFLVGAPARDERLEARLRDVEPRRALPPSRAAVARVIGEILRDPGAPHVQLVVASAEEARPLFAAVAAEQGRALWELPAWALPDAPEERVDLLWTCARDARLCGALVLLDVASAGEPAHARATVDFATRAPDPLLLCGPEVVRPKGRRVFSASLPRLPHEEAKDLWRQALNGAADAESLDVAGLAARFQLSPDGIASAATSVAHRPAGEPPGRAVWRACRLLSRARLDDLAQRIEPDADWDRLILPPEEIRTLRAIEAQVRHRARVFHQWGFSRQGERGSGTAAIFSGPSGTGKTMAAEVLAGALELDLYRIDLSSVVSKYIGETEKNLRRVFDAAEEGGAILLFDEADALFGKRTEVKDSHDRHANIEVSYLLQRMESYQGLAILTTNLRKNIDDAFLRRIQFVVEFPFPDATQRERIWRAVFPPQTPIDGVDPRRLARLAVAGGNIKNIARNAAYLAAAQDRPVGMQHLLEATRLEYTKLGQPLTPTELRGWLS